MPTEQYQHNTALTSMSSIVDVILKGVRTSTKVRSKVNTAMTICRASVGEIFFAAEDDVVEDDA